MVAGLPDRVRAGLAGRDVREVRMFGGLSFLVDDRMVAAARRGGELLLRIDPARSAELRAQPGAGQATMGPGRPMGDGWLAVAEDALTDDALAGWLAIALAYRDSCG